MHIIRLKLNNSFKFFLQEWITLKQQAQFFNEGEEERDG